MDIPEYLKQLTEWILEKKPFYHVRYNDGESLSMFSHFGRGGCRRHDYTRGIGKALQNTLQEIVQDARERILFGTNCDVFTGIDGGALSDYLKKHPCLTRVFPGDSWYTTVEETANGTITDKGLFALIDAIRFSDNAAILVSNSLLVDARHCFGAEHVNIPPKNGWDRHEKILEECLQKGDDTTTYVWCAGFPGKVLSWDIWKQRPNTSHIDLGSLFDCVFHVGIASWMLRRGNNAHQSHRKFVEKEIEPYVKSFVPGAIE